MSVPILCLSSVQLARLGAVEIHVCVCKTSLVYISNQSSTQRLATGVESRINIELVCSPSFAIILIFKSTFTFKHLLVDFSFSLQSIALNSFLCHAPWRNGMFRLFLNRICPHFRTQEQSSHSTNLNCYTRSNLIFIGPESDHWLCLSLTDSLTNSLTPVQYT